MRTLAALACCVAGLVALLADERAGADDANPPVPPLPADLKVVRTIDVGYSPAGSLHFSPDGKELVGAVGVFGTVRGAVRFWDPLTGKATRDPWTLKYYAGVCGFVDAKTVALVEAVEGNVITLREYPSGKEVARLDCGRETLRDVAVGGGVVAAISSGSKGLNRVTDERVRVWSASGKVWRERWAVSTPIATVAKKGAEDSHLASGLALSPDATRLAVSSDQGRVFVYRVADGELLLTAERNKLGASEPLVAFSPDGRDVAVTSRYVPLGDGGHGFGVGLWDDRLAGRRAGAVWERGSRDGDWSQPGRPVFTPDGKTLVVPCGGRMLRLYEVATGGLRHAGRLPCEAVVFALSPDVRMAAVGDGAESEAKVFVIDWRAAAGKRELPAEAALDAAWGDLASPDSAVGFRAVVALGAVPTRAAGLLGAKLRPFPVPKAEVVKALFVDLGSEDFAAREAATQALAALGDAVEPELRAASQDESPERRGRAAKLLATATRRDRPDRLRALRAVEVLEYADTPAGRDVLKALAGGAPAAGLTRDAKAALARLTALDPKP